MTSNSRLLTFLRGCCALFGVGDKGVEARVAVERLEILFLVDVQVGSGRETVVHCVLQRREPFVAAPLACQQASQLVLGGSRVGMPCPKRPTLDFDCGA